MATDKVVSLHKARLRRQQYKSFKRQTISLESLALPVRAEPVEDKPLAHDSRLWGSSLLIVLLAGAMPVSWWLLTSRPMVLEQRPATAMVVELAPAPVAPISEADTPPVQQQTEIEPPEPEVEPEPIPEPEPETEPPPPPAPEPEVVLPKPQPKPKPPVKPEPPVEEKPAESPPEERQTPAAASAPPPTSQAAEQAKAPSQEAIAPAAPSAGEQSWRASLVARLDKAKRYPRRARRLRQEGVSYLRFSMDRDGNILSSSLERSSGHPLLDEETLALLKRAEPLPPPPPVVAGERLEFVVPVEFILKR
ncbi:MAG: energy transducer TonB [Gammaproteobacteria bacterium]|nr:energy transducer TonB [Gammaproteobacteria bacterium]